VSAAQGSHDGFGAIELAPLAFVGLRPVRDANDRVSDFEWTYVNAEAERLLGMKRAGLVGRHILDVLPGTWNAPGLFDACVRVLITGEHEQITVESANAVAGCFKNTICAYDDGVAIWFGEIAEYRGR